MPHTPKGPAELQARQAIYHALDQLEGWLTDGHHRPGPEPDFQPLQSAKDRPEASQDRQPDQTLPGQDSLERLSQELYRCMACRLAASRRQVVVGRGSLHPRLLVIGEAPSAEDDASGQAFDGESGQLLRRMLAAIDIRMDEDCYLTQVVKCRPSMDRDPAPDEQSSCQPFLRRQLALLKPKAVLCLGRIPSQLLLGSRDGLQKLRGRVYDLEGRPCVVSHSLPNLLRDPAMKRPAWEDLKLLQAILHDV